MPGRTYYAGKIHPVSQVIDEVTSIFSEIGFSVDANDISDVSLRRAVGMRDEVKTLTWREMQDRRVSMMERLSPQNISAVSDDKQNNSGQ